MHSGGRTSIRSCAEYESCSALSTVQALDAIELTPRRELDFTPADGRIVRRRVSECYIILPQGEAHTPAVLGEPGDDEALLGIVTLEILGLVFDPFRRTLEPMRMLLV